MKYWLMKSEPDVFSIENLRLAEGSKQRWDGVRNYQARNYMRDEMKVGDGVIFYHSSCPVPGVAGFATVSADAVPDHTSWDPASEYFDPKSSEANPRWFMVEIAWRRTLPRVIPLEELRANPRLAVMMILRKGNRLSITPVTKAEFAEIERMAT